MHLFSSMSSRWLKTRVEKKPLFSFSRKAKIRSLFFAKFNFAKTFAKAKIFRFREIFLENFCFCEGLAKISRKVFVFTKIFRFCVCYCKYFCVLEAENNIFQMVFNIHQCFRSGYSFSWLLDPDPHSKGKISHFFESFFLILSYIYLQPVGLHCYFFTQIYNIYNDRKYFLKIRLYDDIARHILMHTGAAHIDGY
jgi:hypothetical protein